MSQPYLFYSEKCPHSKQIIETLKALNKTSLYKFILVESLNRNQIPQFLKKVPTLYNPESKEVVVGKDIFGYIAKPTNSRKELPVKEEAQQNKQGGNSDNISAWGFEGAGSLSEAFSDWNAPTSFSSDGNSMYTFLGGNVQTMGPPEPKTENTLSKSKNSSSDEVSARMEALQNQRKSEFNGIQRK
jgi:glutaredoxin-related protein